MEQEELTPQTSDLSSSPIKRALQRLVKNPDGSYRILYIDLDSLSYLDDITGYNLVNPDNKTVEVTENGDPEGPVVSTEPAKPGTPVQLPSDTSGVSDRPFVSSQRVQGTVTPTTGNIRQPAQKDISSVPPGTQNKPNYPSNTFRSLTAADAQTPQGQITQSRPQGFVGQVNPLGVGNVTMNNKNPEGRFRDIDSGFKSFLSSTVSDTLGPNYGVNVFSGDIDPEDIGWSANKSKLSRSHRHTDNLGADVNIVKPDGSFETNPVALRDIAMAAAARDPTVGVGYGQYYMGPDAMHIDQTGRGGSWGGGFGVTGRENIDFARQYGIGPTPTYNAPTPEGFAASPATATGDFLGDRGSYGKSVMNNPNKFDGLDTATPAKMASMGFVQRTPQQIDAISYTLAGELSPTSLKGVLNGDEEATRELANMVTSIENRAQSKMYGSLENALKPSQYNSIGKPNTRNNYNIYGNTIAEKVKGFYAGELQPDNYDISNYYAPDTMRALGKPDPSWSGLMSNVADTGEHRFGSISTYGPSKGFMADRQHQVEGKRDTDRSYTPSQNYSGGGWSVGGSGKDSPSETSGIGRGSTASFGGKTSGTSGISPSSVSSGGRPGAVGKSGVGGGFTSSKSAPSGKNKDGTDNGWGGRSGSV